MSEKSRKDHIETAAKAHTDLNLLHAIIALCEHSLFSTDCHGVERHIVRYCNAEADKCLRRYDKAMTLATKEARRKMAVELDNVVNAPSPPKEPSP